MARTPSPATFLSAYWTKQRQIEAIQLAADMKIDGVAEYAEVDARRFRRLAGLADDAPIPTMDEWNAQKAEEAKQQG